MSAVAEIDQLIWAERHRDAWISLDREMAEVPSGTHPPVDLLLRRARLIDVVRNAPVDEALLALDQILATPDLAPDIAAEAHSRRIRGLIAKRYMGPARDAVDRARSETDDHPVVSLAVGIAAFAYWEQAQAEDWFALALAGAGDRPDVQLSLAKVRYAMGDLDAANIHAEAVAPAAAEFGHALRLRAAVHAALGRHDVEANLVSEVIAARPDSDLRVDDTLWLGIAAASAGLLDTTRAVFDGLWRAHPDTPQGRLARRHAEQIASPDHDGGERRRLVARTRTTPIDMAAAPAAIEMAARYLPFELPPSPHATAGERSVTVPLHRVASDLSAAGLVVRRTAATTENLRTAVALGLPVVVQKEYDTPLDPEIIIGFDDRLGAFFIDAPRRMGPGLIPYDSHRLADSSALILLGSGDHAAQVAHQADQYGLVDDPDVRRLDQIDQLRLNATAGGALGNEDLFNTIIRQCDEILDRSPESGPTWFRKMAALTDHPDADAEFAPVGSMLAKHGAADWPHRCYAQWLTEAGRSGEAYVSYIAAMNRAGRNAEDLTQLGRHSRALGRLSDAEDHLLEAIGLAPTSVAAARDLAAVYLTAIESRQLKDSAPDPRSPLGLVRFATAEVEDDLAHHTTAELFRRTRHFSNLLLDQAPEDPFSHQLAGFHALYSDNRNAAAAHLNAAVHRGGTRRNSLLALAALKELRGQHDEAAVLYKEVIADDEDDGDLWVAAARFHQRVGDIDTALEIVHDGIATLGGPRLELVRTLFELESKRSSRHEAAQTLAHLVSERQLDRDLSVSAAEELRRQTFLGPALLLMRRQVDSWPSHPASLQFLGRLLSQDPLTRRDGRLQLERAHALDPSNHVTLRLLALSWRDDDPERGLAMLPESEVLDGYDIEVRAALLYAAGERAESDREVHAAIDLLGGPPAVVDLLRWHLDHGRSERAVELTGYGFEQGLPRGLMDEAERLTIEAHRLAGQQFLIIEDLRNYCADEVPRHLAVAIYTALRGLEPELAAKAALSHADNTRDLSTRLRFRILAAGQLGLVGRTDLLVSVEAECGDDEAAWALLADAWLLAGNSQSASNATIRAVELNPTGLQALAAGFDTFAKLGQVDQATIAANQLVERFSHLPHGWERLALLHAKLGDVAPAATMSARAVVLDPFRARAHAARAVVLLMAGDIERARLHASRALILHIPERQIDGTRDDLLVQVAAQQDIDGLNRCLANLELHEPPEVFAPYKQALVNVAHNRAPDAEPVAELDFTAGKPLPEQIGLAPPEPTSIVVGAVQDEHLPAPPVTGPEPLTGLNEPEAADLALVLPTGRWDEDLSPEASPTDRLLEPAVPFAPSELGEVAS